MRRDSYWFDVLAFYLAVIFATAPVQAGHIKRMISSPDGGLEPLYSSKVQYCHFVAKLGEGTTPDKAGAQLGVALLSDNTTVQVLSVAGAPSCNRLGAYLDEVSVYPAGPTGFVDEGHLGKPLSPPRRAAQAPIPNAAVTLLTSHRVLHQAMIVSGESRNSVSAESGKTAGQKPNARPHGSRVACSDPNRPVSISGEAVEPEYPDGAREAGAVGTATVRVFIDKNGKVTNAVIDKSAGNDTLDAAAINAARATAYKPELLECRPQEGTYLFQSDFTGQ